MIMITVYDDDDTIIIIIIIILINVLDHRGTIVAACCQEH